MDPSAITRPADCALALAIPWTRTDFLAQLAQDCPREFAKWYRRANGGANISEESLWRQYEKAEGGAIGRLVERCESVGVTVDRRCTLASFARLAQQFAVVIVVAHWRTGALELQDVRMRSRFFELLLTASDGPPASLRRQLATGGQLPLLELARHVPDDDGAVSALLNALSEVMMLGPIVQGPGTIPEAPSRKEFYLARNRALLNEACRSVLNGGAGLELCDATHTAETVAAALGGRCTGLLDLAVCNSYLLGEVIKRANPECLIMVNRNPTSALARLLVAQQVVAILAKHRGSYVQLAMKIRTASGAE
jgi:hypothetical protein